MSKEWAERAALPGHVVDMISNFPQHMHPMTQLVSAVSALQTESRFAAAYANKSLNKVLSFGIMFVSSHERQNDYWEEVYEDSVDLIAKLPVVAASIFRNCYADGEVCSLVRHTPLSSFEVRLLPLTHLLTGLPTSATCSGTMMRTSLNSCAFTSPSMPVRTMV